MIAVVVVVVVVVVVAVVLLPETVVVVAAVGQAGAVGGSVACLGQFFIQQSVLHFMR